MTTPEPQTWWHGIVAAGLMLAATLWVSWQDDEESPGDESPGPS